MQYKIQKQDKTTSNPLKREGGMISEEKRREKEKVDKCGDRQYAYNRNVNGPQG
jgi:hypothetical protein